MKLVTLIIGTFWCFLAHAQEQMKPIVFTLQPSIGISIPLSSIQNGSITDNLISNKETPSFYLQVSSNYFWKHWGLGGSITFNTSNNRQNFVDDVQQYYSDKYYVNTYDYSRNTSFTTQITKLLFGPSYKVEKGKFIFIYKLQMGINQFKARSSSAYLKEKNSNTIITLNWNYDHPGYDPEFFCISPSISMAYRFTNRISLSFDIMLMHSTGSFKYYQVSEDINTHQTQTKTFEYDNAINEVNLGGSLLYLFYRKSKTNKI